MNIALMEFAFNPGQAPPPGQAPVAQGGNFINGLQHLERPLKHLCLFMSLSMPWLLRWLFMWAFGS
jgi:hypothetical protein